MRNDGGSAFPRQPRIIHPQVGETVMEQGGMSLRDYFAAAAMQGVARDYGVTAEGRARQCYEYADAMLAEREKS